MARRRFSSFARAYDPFFHDRTNTGNGPRQPGLIVFARKTLTRIYGLTPRNWIAAEKYNTLMAISRRLGGDDDSHFHDPSSIVNTRCLSNIG
jgi:hypothetical protein